MLTMEIRVDAQTIKAIQKAREQLTKVSRDQERLRRIMGRVRIGGCATSADRGRRR